MTSHDDSKKWNANNPPLSRDPVHRGNVKGGQEHEWDHESHSCSCPPLTLGPTVDYYGPPPLSSQAYMGPTLEPGNFSRSGRCYVAVDRILYGNVR